jgi:hypothetical protein
MRWILAVLLMLAVTATARAQPCCGPITPAGDKLARFLDDSDVMRLWLAGTHVIWQTGEPDPERPGGTGTATHCSAFAAAMAMRLDIYVLRPPEHGQTLLANAQMHWLLDHGVEHAWRTLASYVGAQKAANRGELVLEAFENPNPTKPGHIAIVRPSEMSRAELDRDGPLETQAGSTNALSTTTAEGFVHHPGAWLPGGTGAIRYYAHTVTWQ